MESEKSSEQLNINKRRTFDRIPFSLVPRPSDVFFVGDLNGRLLALYKNCEFAGLIDGSHNWIGENKVLVFTGDLIGDRYPEGLQILLEIDRIRKQARMMGGDIVLIAGNHDELLISYLRDSPVPNYQQRYADGTKYPQNCMDAVSVCRKENMGLGITELLQFLPITKKDKKKDLFNLLLKRHISPSQMNGFHQKGTYRNKEILEKMRNDPEGRIILETICSFHLITQIDDNLAQHCPLNEQMAYLIQIFGIDTLNSLYQSILRRDLLGEKIKISKTMNKLFESLRTAFLATENRAYLSNEYIDFSLSEKGVNFNVHGHNPEGGKIYKIGKNIHCANIDFGAFYGDNWEEINTPCSLAKVESKGGQILLSNPQNPIIFQRENKESPFELEGITTKVHALLNNLDMQEHQEDHEKSPK
ncbi:MAG: metallophosphoesterase [Candidatus Gracilibacteria bacterium]|jgi:hypothetical protein|nr:metallophosphoesterase [Candidatus Gracilibacteria bacterium]